MSAVVVAATTLASCAAQSNSTDGLPGAHASADETAIASLGASAVPSSKSPILTKHVETGTGHLKITLSPTAGPVGTVVKIRGTGCGDADGENHAVSFNPYDETSSTGLDNVRAILWKLTGQMISASYTIVTADADAAVARTGVRPEFYVQCATDLAEAPFTITH
jgi:hypothetical protein